MSKIIATFRSINRKIAIVSISTLLILMIVVTVDVLGRFFFSKTVPGAMEISQLILAVVVLLGLANTQALDGHVNVSVLLSRLSGRPRSILDAFIAFLGLGIWSLMLWAGINMSLHSLSTTEGTTILAIPIFFYNFLVPLGALLMCGELLAELLYFLHQARGGG